MAPPGPVAGRLILDPGMPLVNTAHDWNDDPPVIATDPLETVIPRFVAYVGSPGGANQVGTFVVSGPLAYSEKLSWKITMAFAPKHARNSVIILPSSFSLLFIFFCRVCWSFFVVINLFVIRLKERWQRPETGPTRCLDSIFPHATRLRWHYKHRPR